MLVYGAIDVASLLALAIGVIGLAGVLFTALRFRRDDTTAVVSQQAQITTEMKALNDELRLTATSLREERDGLRVQVDRLTGQIEALRIELHEAQAQVSGKMSRIERRSDDG
jgi:uncharacterized protein HemX